MKNQLQQIVLVLILSLLSGCEVQGPLPDFAIQNNSILPDSLSVEVLRDSDNEQVLYLKASQNAASTKHAAMESFASPNQNAEPSQQAHDLWLAYGQEFCSGQSPAIQLECEQSNRLWTMMAGSQEVSVWSSGLGGNQAHSDQHLLFYRLSSGQIMSILFKGDPNPFADFIGEFIQNQQEEK